MRKFLLFAVAIVVVAWLLMWAGARFVSRSYTTTESHAWPLDLGTIEKVPERYPSAEMSAGALNLIQLAAKVQIELAPRHLQSAPPPVIDPLRNTRQAVTDYVRSQIERADATIDAPPPQVGDFLAGHAGDIAAIRAHLISGDRFEWPSNMRAGVEAPVPNLLGHMQLARLLQANALDRARRGDRLAWDDLQASWMLTSPLWRRPELISTLIGIAIARNANAIARKLPVPEPAWLAELQTFDYRRAALAAFQAEAYSIKDRTYVETTVDGDGVGRRMLDVVLAPYTSLSASDAIEAQRQIAQVVATNESCDFKSVPFLKRVAWWNLPARYIQTPNIDSLWVRIFRFRAETEATARVFRVRKGEPPLPSSACAGGKWIYSDSGFHFEPPLPKQEPPMIEIPVRYDARQ